MSLFTQTPEPIVEDIAALQKRVSAGLKNIRSGSIFRSALNAITFRHDSEPDSQPVLAVKRVQDGDAYLSETSMRLIREISLHELQLQPLLEQQEKIKTELHELNQLSKQPISIKAFALGSVFIVSDRNQSNQRLIDQIKKLRAQLAALETEANEIQTELTTKQTQLSAH